MVEVPKISLGTWLRTIALLLAFVNQGLVTFGHSPIPFDSEKVELFVADAITGVTAIIAWWKHNSFTKRARLNEKNKLY